jgi:hypothetical protein
MKTNYRRGRQPIADKVLKRIEKEVKRDVVDISAARAGRRQAREMQQTLESSFDLSELPLSFAAYAWTQQQLSLMCEQLLALQSLHRFHEILARAEELYEPEGPPISPLTRSFYSCWMMFDLGLGIGKETLGSIAFTVMQKYGAHEKFLELARHLLNSRNGVYQVLAVTDGLTTMKDLWSGDEFVARSSSGYHGEVREIWFTRALPPNDMEPDVHVIINTPYVMHQTSKQGWMEYFKRALVDSDKQHQARDLHLHMKYGDEPFYWPEYIFYSYVNHTDSFIWSKGLPDIAESLPHRDEYQKDRIW